MEPARFTLDSAADIAIYLFRQGYPAGTSTPAGTSLRFPVIRRPVCARAERRAAGPPRRAGGAGRRAAGIAASRGGERERASTASMSTRARVHTPPLRRPGRGPQVELGHSGRGRRAERIHARGARRDANGTPRRDAFRRAAQRATRPGVTSDDATRQRAAGDVLPAAQTARCTPRRAGAGSRTRVEAQACSVEGRRRAERPYQRKRVSTPVPRHERCTPAPR
jgi:hypothetical protein